MLYKHRNKNTDFFFFIQERKCDASQANEMILNRDNAKGEFRSP